MIDISKLERTKERNRLFIPEQYADALEWQLQQAGVTNFEVIHCWDKRSESIPDKPKLIKANYEDKREHPYMTDNIASIVSHFTKHDIINKIVPQIFNDDWFEEDNKRTKEKWIRNFGTEEPCPFK